MTNLPPYTILEKKIGETPLECVEQWRSRHPAYAHVPLAYAGRLDPMASGSLLILIGEECKVQEKYHSLDKTYVFDVLFGVNSDSGDVLGLVTEIGEKIIQAVELKEKIASFVGPIELPYPVFSARTVHGKPLHTWAMEGRLHEITIPTKKSTVFELRLETLKTLSRAEIYSIATAKITSLPRVTDLRKALGNDFRRPDVLQSWSIFESTGQATDFFSVATFHCTASSGTYMRTLSEEIARAVSSTGLAFSIHRTEIGVWSDTQKSWSRKFTSTHS